MENMQYQQHKFGFEEISARTEFLSIEKWFMVYNR